MKLLTRIMHEEEADWIQLLTAILQSSCSGWRDRPQENFRIQEFLLLGPKPLWKIAKTVKWILADVATMLDWKTLRPLFRRCDIHTIQDLFMQNGRRRLLTGLDREIEQKDESLTHLENLESWVGQTVLIESRVEESGGWTWRGDNGSIKNWATPNSTWRRILTPRVDEDSRLHDKWPGSGRGMNGMYDGRNYGTVSTPKKISSGFGDCTAMPSSRDEKLQK
ncbi:hypothetical protein R1sor_019574 [Riccia sorocarpa]|uniref:Uncharacterized protein n=1 Tax=Riccia sorocarpa TaxID=122646 RepID=A0ABD3ID20_9MARC